MTPLDEKWLQRISCIEYAFQPIVNIHTGFCYGLEALLRNYEAAGFDSIGAFFDKAFEDRLLYRVDLMLREKALKKLSLLGWNRQIKLFFNLDNRVLDSENYRSGNTIELLSRYGLPRNALCFEISEKHEIHDPGEALRTLDVYRSQGFKIAVDDYGAGFAGLKLLYYAKPDFIKIDRFFISDISKDPNKRLFVSSIVNIAHLMGSVVIAEGVETRQEFFSCRDIGCDLIQGYFVAHPEIDICCLEHRYKAIEELGEKDRRNGSSEDKQLIDMEIEDIEPVECNCDIFDIFERFRSDQGVTFLPVVNDMDEPLGVICEDSLKQYVYSQFGTALLQNPAFGRTVSRFISRYPIADINTPAEKILEIYSRNDKLEGILIVENLKYRGFLSAHSLLKVLNEKNIAIARDQNPLSKLPGNTLIHEYVSQAIGDLESGYAFIYFDFDNFKPYNDKYGFRQGDRVILLFADMLKTRTQFPNRFAGHIGGDDFFMGVHGLPVERVLKNVLRIARQFQVDVESFYDPEAIRKGSITAENREGEQQTFPLLTVSAVILELPAGRKSRYSNEEISNIMARQKKIAKKSPEKISILCLTENSENHVKRYEGGLWAETGKRAS